MFIQDQMISIFVTLRSREMSESSGKSGTIDPAYFQKIISHELTFITIVIYELIRSLRKTLETIKTCPYIPSHTWYRSTDLTFAHCIKLALFYLLWRRKASAFSWSGGTEGRRILLLSLAIRSWLGRLQTVLGTSEETWRELYNTL